MATKEENLKHLNGMFRGKILLSPDDLMQAIPWERQSIYNKLSKGTFPLPVKKIGKNVFVNIHDLAEFLATEQPVNKARADNLPARKARLEAQGIILFQTSLREKIAETLRRELDTTIAVPAKRKIEDIL